MSPAPVPPAAPILSVIVPVRNEEGYIRPCIESILAEAPAGGIEVIVVDGMSDDSRADVAAEMAAGDFSTVLADAPG